MPNSLSPPLLSIALHLAWVIECNCKCDYKDSKRLAKRVSVYVCEDKFASCYTDAPTGTFLLLSLAIFTIYFLSFSILRLCLSLPSLLSFSLSLPLLPHWLTLCKWHGQSIDRSEVQQELKKRHNLYLGQPTTNAILDHMLCYKSYSVTKPTHTNQFEAGTDA